MQGSLRAWVVRTSLPSGYSFKFAVAIMTMTDIDYFFPFHLKSSILLIPIAFAANPETVLQVCVSNESSPCVCVALPTRPLTTFFCHAYRVYTKCHPSCRYHHPLLHPGHGNFGYGYATQRLQCGIDRTGRGDRYR